jgi:acetyltransferase
MTSIARLSETEARAAIDQLVALLTDTVDHGASVGFLRPLDAVVAGGYWQEVLAGVAKGTKILLAARLDGRIVGSVQLELAQRPNGVHRAEVQKLIVLSGYRRRGVATELMQAIEEEARAARRSLLVLDTESRSGAEPFYESLQWQRAGSIPDFALSTDGVPTPNVIFYKRI